MEKYNLNYPVLVQLTNEGLLHWVKSNNEKLPPIAHISFKEALNLKIKDTEYWAFPFNVFCNIFGSKMNVSLEEPCNYWIEIETSRLLEDNELFTKEDVIKIVAHFAKRFSTDKFLNLGETLTEGIKAVEDCIDWRVVNKNR